VAVQEIIHQITTFFHDPSEIEVCLLYGSAAELPVLPAGSDVDIAICGSNSFSNTYLADLQLKLSKKLAREVDLLDLNRIDGLILMKVITKGIKVINRKPELLAYHIKRMLFFREDMYPNIQMMQKAKVKRFAYGR
jgi:predicted nucleotidyltransferase